MTYGTLIVNISADSVSFIDNGGYESRNKSTVRMIEEAFRRSPPNNVVPKRVTIHTEDGFNPSVDFSYAITGRHQVLRCFPHFLFDSWPEVGIASYSDMFDSMIDAGSTPPTDNRAFWIGANTNALRREVCSAAVHYPTYMDFRMMSWNRTDPASLHTHTPQYVSLVDHCKYRVLVDLGAGGFSARLPLLFASGRPVILADRKLESWFYWDGTLQPWVHYIPGGDTAKSVIEAIHWTFVHPEKAYEIGVRGQEYARKHLTHDAAIIKCAELLWGMQ